MISHITNNVDITLQCSPKRQKNVQIWLNYNKTAKLYQWRFAVSFILSNDNGSKQPISNQSYILHKVFFTTNCYCLLKMQASELSLKLNPSRLI